MKLVNFTHTYENVNCCVIYETSWKENNETFYYIGSHFVNKKSDSYYGSTKKIFELKKNNVPLSFKVIHEVKQNENRYSIEGQFIKQYIEKYGKNCINKNINPITNHSIRWDEDRRKKFSETSKERFGTESPFQSEYVKNKIKKTCEIRYGESHHLKNKDILEKQKNTNIEKYGVDNISKLESVKNKKKETLLKKGKTYKDIFNEAMHSEKAIEKRRKAIKELNEKKTKENLPFKKHNYKVWVCEDENVEFNNRNSAINFLIERKKITESKRNSAATMLSKVSNNKKMFLYGYWWTAYIHD